MIKNDKMIDIKIENSEKSYSNLIKKRTIIPICLQKKLENALLGGKLPTKLEWDEYHNDLESFSLTNKFLISKYKFIFSKEDIFDLNNVNYFMEALFHQTLKNQIGWGIPTEEGICQIVNYLLEKKSNGLLEIGMGSGFYNQVLKSRLSKFNIDVTGCELNLRNDTPKPFFSESLELDGVNALKKFPQYDILFVWPDTNDISELIIKKMNTNQSLILDTNIEVSGNQNFYNEIDQMFIIKNSLNSKSFSGGDSDLFILEKQESPILNHNNYFSNMFKKTHKSFISKMKKT